MDFSGSGAFGGGTSGAALGSYAGPWGALIGGGLGAITGGLFGGKKVRPPDISGELAKISDLYSRARQAAIDSVNREAALGRSAAASNLAARGTYTSPVAENTFGRLENSRLGAISDVSGKLAGEQANAMSDLLRASMGLSYQAQQQNAANNASLFSGIGGIANSVLLSRLLRPQAQPQFSGGIAGAGPVVGGSSYPDFFGGGGAPSGPGMYYNPNPTALMLRAFGRP